MHINLLIKRAACVYKCMQFSITQQTARELMAVCPPRPAPAPAPATRCSEISIAPAADTRARPPRADHGK